MFSDISIQLQLILYKKIKWKFSFEPRGLFVCLYASSAVLGRDDMNIN